MGSAFLFECNLVQARLAYKQKSRRMLSCGLLNFVGMTGFEPATTRPPDVYSNRAELHPEFHTQRVYLVFGTANIVVFFQKQHFLAIFLIFFIFPIARPRHYRIKSDESP